MVVGANGVVIDPGTVRCSFLAQVDLYGPHETGPKYSAHIGGAGSLAVADALEEVARQIRANLPPTAA